MNVLAPVYYNEIDKHAAAWLRELVRAGHLPHGDVDERSIEDVVPGDLRHYRQCHFFAGIGGWALALKLARWPDDIPVWTGSCPCQPFSAAGQGTGFEDERHLWPAFHHLIAQCRPPVVLGEQVASAAAGPWLHLVRSDMEALGSAFGAVAFPAAGIGAPHIRDRTYWGACWLGDGDVARLERLGIGHQAALGRLAPSRPVSETGEPCGLAHADSGARGQGSAINGGRDSRGDEIARPRPCGDGLLDGGRPGPLHGFWSPADWLLCRDSKWRPVEPGTFPLAHGLPARVVRLRGYGNAIVPEQAAEFILAITEAFLETFPNAGVTRP